MTQSRYLDRPAQLSQMTELAPTSRVQPKSDQANCSESNGKGGNMPQATLQTQIDNPFTTYRDPKTGRWVVVFPENQDPRQRQAEEYKSAS